VFRPLVSHVSANAADVVDRSVGSSRTARKVILDDSSAFHYEFDVLQHCDVDSGIALNRNQVGELSDLDGAEAADVDGGRALVRRGISPGLDESHVGDPVPRAACEADILAFLLEGCRGAPEQGRWYAIEGVDADDGVEMTVDTACDHRDDAAAGADVKLGGLGPEGILGDERRVADSHLEVPSRAGSPHAAMLGAERAIARAGGYLGRFRLPDQGKRDVFAVTAAGDQPHVDPLLDTPVDFRIGFGSQPVRSGPRSEIMIRRAILN